MKLLFFILIFLLALTSCFQMDLSDDKRDIQNIWLYHSTNFYGDTLNHHYLEFTSSNAIYSFPKLDSQTKDSIASYSFDGSELLITGINFDNKVVKDEVWPVDYHYSYIIAFDKDGKKGKSPFRKS